IINLRNDLDNQIALNRELTKALELAIKRAECPLEDFTFKTEFCAENCNANKPDIECWLQLAKYELEKAEGVE
ncbi:MAG: hypothetical protein H0Z24_06650, partial [Thermosipho sp. (in: Bacteria)]|nr:hypothetical protein [Thermosipho sp. (in: thermotogales)]